MTYYGLVMDALLRTDEQLRKARERQPIRMSDVGGVWLLNKEVSGGVSNPSRRHCGEAQHLRRAGTVQAPVAFSLGELRHLLRRFIARELPKKLTTAIRPEAHEWQLCVSPHCDYCRAEAKQTSTIAVLAHLSMRRRLELEHAARAILAADAGHR